MIFFLICAYTAHLASQGNMALPVARSVVVYLPCSVLAFSLYLWRRNVYSSWLGGGSVASSVRLAIIQTADLVTKTSLAS